jgi:hypothetical protein
MRMSRLINIAAFASVAGIVAPLLWLLFMNCCSVPQFPATPDGQPPRPRLVDDAVRYTPYVLWPAGVLFMSPTVSNPPPSRAELYGEIAALIVANAILYVFIACGISLFWTRRKHPQNRLLR